MTPATGVVSLRSHPRGVDIDIYDGEDCSASGGASGGGGGGGDGGGGGGGDGGYSDTGERALKSVIGEENSPDVGGVFRGEGEDEPAPLSLTSGNVVAWRSTDVGGVFRGGAGVGGTLGGPGGDEHAQAMAAVVGAALRAEKAGEVGEEEEPRGPRVVSEALSDGAPVAKADAAKEEVMTRLIGSSFLILVKPEGKGDYPAPPTPLCTAPWLVLEVGAAVRGDISTQHKGDYRITYVLCTRYLVCGEAPTRQLHAYEVYQWCAHCCL